MILEKEDLWNNLRERGRRLKVNIPKAEEELNEADENWMERLMCH